MDTPQSPPTPPRKYIETPHPTPLVPGTAATPSAPLPSPYPLHSESPPPKYVPARPPEKYPTPTPPHPELVAGIQQQQQQYQHYSVMYCP